MSDSRSVEDSDLRSAVQHLRERGPAPKRASRALAEVQAIVDELRAAIADGFSVAELARVVGERLGVHPVTARRAIERALARKPKHKPKSAQERKPTSASASATGAPSASPPPPPSEPKPSGPSSATDAFARSQRRP